MSPLLVQNEAGYQNLIKLFVSAYLDVEAGDWAHVNAEKLFAHSDGLIALTGGLGGGRQPTVAGGPAGLPPRKSALDRLATAFRGRLYVELQRHGLAEERATEDALLEMAYDKNLPLVATNDVHFGKANMYEAHDALLCIADGAFVSQDDRRRLTREHRFKTATGNAGTVRRPAGKRSRIRWRLRAAVPSSPASANPSCRLFVPESGKIGGRQN